MLVACKTTIHSADICLRVCLLSFWGTFLFCLHDKAGCKIADSHLPVSFRSLWDGSSALVQSVKAVHQILRLYRRDCEICR